MKSKHPVTTAVIISVALVLSGVLFYWQSGISSLSRSLDVLLRNHLHLKYHVKKRVLEAATIDQAGVWWIILDDALQEIAISDSSSILQPADEYDRSYYRVFFKEQLDPEVPLESYQLYRGEAVLGPNSACENSPCNLVALAKRGDRNVFISISTN